MRGDRAESATLGLMVFSASVLTGAAVVAVMIGATQDMQEGARSAATGAAEDLVPAVQVRSLVGHRDASEPVLARLTLSVTPTPGVTSLALRELAIQATGSEGSATFTLEGAKAFTFETIIDAEPKSSAAEPVLSPGDLAQITLDTGTHGPRLPPRAKGTLLLLMPHARAERVAFVVPAGMQAGEQLELHSDPTAPPTLAVREAPAPGSGAGDTQGQGPEPRGGDAPAAEPAEGPPPADGPDPAQGGD